MNSNLLTENVRTQVGASHGASGQGFNVCAALSRNLAPCPPVADDGLADAKCACESGNAAEVANGLIERFHEAKHHTTCLRLSTHFVFAASNAA